MDCFTSMAHADETIATVMMICALWLAMSILMEGFESPRVMENQNSQPAHRGKLVDGP